jgi:hypothetical protein
MPWVLWGVERTIQAGERQDRRRLVRSAALLAAAGGLSGLAGHPEMLFATALLAGAYALVRLAAAGPRRAAATVLALLGAAAVALAIAAPQILPFVEYLRVSLVASQPTRFLTAFDPRGLGLLFFPNLAGTPVGHAELAPDLVMPNYQEQTTYYVGGLPLLCAIGASALGVLRTRFALFATLVLLIAVVVWNVAGLGGLLGPIVSFGLIPAGRFYSLWTLAAALLGAWLVQRLADGGAGGGAGGGSPGRAGRAREAIVFGAGALALYAAAAGGAAHFVSSHAAERGLDGWRWLAFAARHLLWISAWYWAGALALSWLVFARSGRTRWTAVGVLCGAQLAMTAPVVGDYVSITPDRRVLPGTPELQALRAAVGDELLLFLGWGGIPADSNAVLGVRSMTHYDALSIRDVQTAAAPIFGPQTYAAEAHKATGRGLRTFGVRYVSTPTEWLPIDTLSSQPGDAREESPYLELLRTIPGADAPTIEIDGLGARQVITAPRDGLAGLVVHLRADREASSTRLSVELRDADGGLVARRELSLGDLRDPGTGRLECVLGFPPIADSAGQSFAVRVRALDDAQPRPRLLAVDAAWAQGLALVEPAANETALARGPEELDGGTRGGLPFVVDLAFGADFVDRGDIGGHSLFEVAGSQGRAWIVSGVAGIDDRDRAFEALMFGEWDPYEHVILEGGIQSRNPGRKLESELQLLHADPQRSRWRARVGRDAFLVVAQPRYPGWRARLDGSVVPILRANYAFSAVALPRGEHQVELAYEPRSVKLGLALGALGWLALALAWFRTRGVP